MLVKTRVFELSDSKYSNLSEMAYAMGISVSQVYRVRQGKRKINQKFIIGAIKAFPGCRFDDLFYLSPDEPKADAYNRLRYPTIAAPAKERQQVGKTPQTRGRLSRDQDSDRG